MAGATPRGARPAPDAALSRLLRLVERHGPDEAARRWCEGLPLKEARGFASPFALTAARRMAATLAEVVELDDGGAA
jgi:hypothetical protein